MSEADFSLLDLFREEARAQAAVLNQGLLELEADPADARLIEPLMRASHSVKGAARIVGIDPAVRLAHAMEDALVAAQHGKIQLVTGDIDVLLRGADLLAGLAEVTADSLPEWGQAHESAIADLEKTLKGIAQGVQAAAPIVVAPKESLAIGPPPKPLAPLPPSPEPGPVAPTPVESVVRVTAQSLNRLMGLAGESLVQARWLQPFAASLVMLKKYQDQLAALLEGVASWKREDPGREVAQARSQLAKCQQHLAERIGEFEDHAAQAEDLNSRLYREVILSRMRPFADGTHGFARLVRDMGQQLGKQVRLQIDGQNTEVDRDILEKLEGPLTHLIRNSVDHGIEPPDVRRAAGKAETGTIRLEARHRAGLLAITVMDDGAGVDVERLRVKIADRGLAPAEVTSKLGEAELLEFLFLPGFSTATALTEYSGRGVGLDVVQNTLRKVGGSVRITSRPGQGTTFHLQLPITLSVIRAVLVEVAGEPFAFPHNRIDRLLRVPRQAIRSLEQRQFVTVDGCNVGLVLAAQLFELAAAPTLGEELAVVLLSDATGTYGLIVDAFKGEQDLVVRPLDPRLGKVPNLSAAAILDNGEPVLIADIEDLVRSMDRYIQAGSLERAEIAQAVEMRRKRILVVEDSITVREVERQILRNRGYEVATAIDGREGWTFLNQGHFDLVITDVDMPRMTGLELLQAIRDDPRLREIPVIMVTYKDREADRQRGLELGASCYLTKASFHDDTFLRAVADSIGEP
jgi:two-component system sensor histidine kinase and response regulator WspE